MSAEFTPVGEDVPEGQIDVDAIKLSGCTWKDSCRVAAAFSVYAVGITAALAMSHVRTHNQPHFVGIHICLLQPNQTSERPSVRGVRGGSWWVEPAALGQASLHDVATLIGKKWDTDKRPVCDVFRDALPSIGLNGLFQAIRIAIGDGMVTGFSARELSHLIGAFAMHSALTKETAGGVAEQWRRSDDARVGEASWLRSGDALPAQVLKIASGLELDGAPLHSAGLRPTAAPG